MMQNQLQSSVIFQKQRMVIKLCFDKLNPKCGWCNDYGCPKCGKHKIKNGDGNGKNKSKINKQL